MEDKIYESKRDGYIEFCGELRAVVDKTKVSLLCLKDLAPVLITIFADGVTVFIDESEGVLRIYTRSRSSIKSNEKRENNSFAK